MRGRDDKFIHAAQQELDSAVRHSDVSASLTFTFLQLQSSEIEITQVVHDM